MYRLAVFQCYYPKVAGSTLGWQCDPAPKANSAIRLNLASDRRRDRILAPLTLDVRPLAQHLILKTARGLQAKLPI